MMIRAVLTLVVALSVSVNVILAQGLPERWRQHSGAIAGTPVSHLIVVPSPPSFDADVVGDVDGDGVRDVAVLKGLPSELDVRSGVDGSMIYSVPLMPLATIVVATGLDSGVQSNPRFLLVREVDDLDGDGVHDLFCSRYIGQVSFGVQPVAWQVFETRSGVDGSLLNLESGQLSPDQLGFGAVWGELIGDLNGDGKRELLIQSVAGLSGISAPNQTVPGTNARALFAVDPMTLGTVGIIASNASFSPMGVDHVLNFTNALIGDWNLDGIQDIGVAINEHHRVFGFDWSYSGCFFIYDGSTLGIMMQLGGVVLPPPHAAGSGTLSTGGALDYESWITGFVGDVDGDGLRDVTISNHHVPSSSITFDLGIYSVATNPPTRLGTLPLLPPQPFWTSALNDAGIGDVDGDGHEDFIRIQDDVSLLPDVWTARDVEPRPRWLDLIDGSEDSWRVLDRGFDLSGDGIDDLLVADEDDIVLLSPVGARRIGSPLNALSIGWKSQRMIGDASGTLRVSGAAPFASGVAAISLASDNASVSGVDIFVSLDALDLITVDSIAFNFEGNFFSYFDVQQPALAGTSLFMQAIELGSGAPRVSPGLEILFGE